MSNQNPNRSLDAPDNVPTPQEQQAARKGSGAGGRPQYRDLGSLSTLEKLRDNEMKFVLSNCYRAAEIAQRSDAGAWVMKRTKSELGRIANYGAWIHAKCLECIDEIKTAEAHYIQGGISNDMQDGHGEDRRVVDTSNQSHQGYRDKDGNWVPEVKAELEHDNFQQRNATKDVDDVVADVDRAYEAKRDDVSSATS